MNEVKTKEIPFYGDTLLGVKDEDGEVWLAIRSTCIQLGFNERRARAQREKIQADKVLSKGGRNFGLLTAGGKQETFCLHETYVPLWLAKITLTKKMEEDIPNVVEKLERYQLEARDVLHREMYGTEEQKEKLHNNLGLQGEIIQLKDAVDSVTEQLKDQTERLDLVMDNMSIDTKKQSRIQKAAKERVSELLGGAHSGLYKAKGALYFANLWHQFREQFECGTYKDLSPNDFEDAIDFIESWTYVER